MIKKWELDYRLRRLQPTVVEKVDIKAIIDTLNAKRYDVDNFKLLSVLDPKVGVAPYEPVEGAKIIFNKCARAIDNSNKPKGWNIYYDNGTQILEMDQEKIDAVASRRMSVAHCNTGEMEQKIDMFTNAISDIHKEVWVSLAEWVKSL